MATGNRLQTMMRMRWAMTAVSAVLAVVLLLSGFVIIGVLVAALTVLRVVMLLKWRGRADELRGRFPRRFGGGNKD